MVAERRRWLDLWKGERRIHLQAPNLIERIQNRTSGGDHNCFRPIHLDYEQEKLHNQPDDKPYVRNDGVHCVDQTIGTTNSKRRSWLSERQKLAKNLREVEKMFSEGIDSRSERAWECIHRDVVNVRHITMESYTWRDSAHCECATSVSCLIFSGFFLSSARKPHTVFSLQLLCTLHEQCTRGYITKLSCAGALRAAFEADNNMVLPDISRPVCPDIA